MEVPLLRDLLVIFCLSIGVLLLCHRLRLPTIVGFLITGVLAGPHAFALVKAVKEVQSLAEVGIALLLFTVGLEFSIKKILAYKRYFLVAGPIQVVLTVLAGMTVAKVIGRSWGESVQLGFLLSLSSTAIVMRLLQERGESDAPHGKISLGILIFQDIAAVIMMLSIPLLAGEAHEFSEHVLISFAKGLAVLCLTFYSAYKLVPILFYYVAQTRSRELFLMTVLALCFAVAWITSAVGLSLALGAFLAGIVISESEYSHQAMGDVVPFQDIFTSFFFVSIGMLLDLHFLVENLATVLLLTAGVLLLKVVIVIATALSLRLPLRTAVLSGMALSQIGEFSFVLAIAGMNAHIGNEYLMGLFLAIAVLTMGLTPLLIAASPAVAALALKLPLPDRIKTGLANGELSKEKRPVDHVIIIGYGFSGKNLARSCMEAEVPYVIIDMNPDTVDHEKRKGTPIYFGDASREHVLSHLNVQEAKAKAVAVVINDPVAATRVVERVRKMNPAVYIVVRTRYLQEMELFFRLGANDVIPDELGAAVEIFSRVLTHLDVPPGHVEQLVSVLRAEGYQMVRPKFFSEVKEDLADVGLRTFELKEGSPFAGRSLLQLEMRKKYGLTVLVVKRNEQTIYQIDPEMVLLARDRIVVIGDKKHLAEAPALFA